MKTNFFRILISYLFIEFNISFIIFFVQISNINIKNVMNSTKYNIEQNIRKFV